MAKVKNWGPLSPIYWRNFIFILTPILLSGLLFMDPKHDKEMKCLFVLLLMAIYWVLQLLPLPVTSFIPVILFPFLGVLSTSEVTSVYLSPGNFIFVGGLIIAIAIESSELDKRIAINFISVVGTSPLRLMGGFMGITSILSMFVSNTATTAMMIPILEAVLKGIDPEPQVTEPEDIEPEVTGPEVTEPEITKMEVTEPEISEPEVTDILKKSPEYQHKRNGFLLSIAYAANIGGTGFLTGSPPNLVVPQNLESKFGDEATMSFLSWALFSIPLMIINVILAWIWLYFLFYSNFSCLVQSLKRKKNEGHNENGYVNNAYDEALDANQDLKNGRINNSTIELNEIGTSSPTNPSNNESELIKRNLEIKKAKLGPWTAREIQIALLFLCAIILWITRSPQIFVGWGDLFTEAKIKDATPAFLIIIALFALPSAYHFWPFSQDPPQISKPLLDWDTVERKLPWGIMFLLGGGYALAKGTRKSGLGKLMISWIRLDLLKLNSAIINLIFCITTCFITEIVSNTATANILVPILLDLALSICENPIYLSLSAALCCSYAFMLPVATAPNALVHKVSTMDKWGMLLPGLVMNVICIITTNIAINLYGGLIFQFSSDDRPQWLQDTLIKEGFNNCTLTN